MQEQVTTNFINPMVVGYTYFLGEDGHVWRTLTSSISQTPPYFSVTGDSVEMVAETGVSRSEGWLYFVDSHYSSSSNSLVGNVSRIPAPLMLERAGTEWKILFPNDPIRDFEKAFSSLSEPERFSMICSVMMDSDQYWRMESQESKEGLWLRHDVPYSRKDLCNLLVFESPSLRLPEESPQAQLDGFHGNDDERQTVSNVGSETGSIIDKLEGLIERRNNGEISADEFKQMKKEILGK